MPHLKSHSFCESDGADSPGLGNDDAFEMLVQKLRSLGGFAASSFTADESYGVSFDHFYDFGAVVVDWQVILNVDLCLLGYHYNISAAPDQ